MMPGSYLLISVEENGSGMDSETMVSIFMSGYTADVIAHHGILQEGINFIQKPFGSKSLSETVRKVLDAS